jgi:hypothetical protein
VAGLASSDAYNVLVSGEQDHFSSLGDYATAAVVGGALGGGLSALSHRLGTRASKYLPEVAQEPVTPKVTPPFELSPAQQEIASAADAAIAKGDMHAAIKHFDELKAQGVPADKVAQLEVASAQQHQRTPVDVYRQPRAMLPNGQAVEGLNSGTVYHGTDQIAPEEAFANGLPARGMSLELLEHSQQKGDSAFRGTNDWVISQNRQGGPGYFAGDGGWVYEIDGVRSWDVNAHLQGRVQMPDGTFGSNLMQAEAEKAILVAVAKERIKGAYPIRQISSGLTKGAFIPNPNYKAR